MYWDRQACANNVDPDQTHPYVTPDKGQCCLLVIQQFFDISTGIKTDFFKFWD